MFVGNQNVPFLHLLESLDIMIGDVGGQRTLRPYWRNYFEQTDAIVWVVDSGDRMRMQDCRDELHSLLLEDASFTDHFSAIRNTYIRIDRDSPAHPYLSLPISRIFPAP